MSTDIKLSKAQLYKIIQSGGSLGSWFGNLGKKKTILNYGVSLAKDFVPVLVSNIAMASSLIQPMDSSLINAITGKRVVRARRGQEGGFIPLLALPLMMKVLGKE